jgi:excisionase family DNA binding protein
MPSASGDEQLLTVDVVAERLGVKAETVRRWLRGGELRGIRFARKAGWRIRAFDLQAYLAAHSNVPQAPQSSDGGQDDEHKG